MPTDTVFSLAQLRKNTFSPSFRQNVQSETPTLKNPLTKRAIIQQFIVIHPLLDRLVEVKMAKCLQHGQLRVFKNQNKQPNKRTKLIQAPSIRGSVKVFSSRPHTSRPIIDYRPCVTARPNTNNTIVRSRTSQPTIHRKLEIISRQQNLETEEQQLKPSFAFNKIRQPA